MNTAVRSIGDMGQRPRTPRKRPARPVPALFIGQWLNALDVRQIDVVRATGINEGYLSNLIGGRKRNPSAAVLSTIANFLGIPLHYLYQPPPTREFINQASSLDPAVLAKLLGPASKTH